MYHRRNFGRNEHICSLNHGWQVKYILHFTCKTTRSWFLFYIWHVKCKKNVKWVIMGEKKMVLEFFKENSELIQQGLQSTAWRISSILWEVRTNSSSTYLSLVSHPTTAQKFPTHRRKEFWLERLWVFIRKFWQIALWTLTCRFSSENISTHVSSDTKFQVHEFAILNISLISKIGSHHKLSAAAVHMFVSSVILFCKIINIDNINVIFTGSPCSRFVKI